MKTEFRDENINKVAESSRELIKALGITERIDEFESSLKAIRSFYADTPNSEDSIKTDILNATSDYVNMHDLDISAYVGKDDNVQQLVLESSDERVMAYNGENADQLIKAMAHRDIMLLSYNEYVTPNKTDPFMGAFARIKATVTKDFVKNLLDNLPERLPDHDIHMMSVNFGDISRIGKFLEQWSDNECKTVKIDISGSNRKGEYGVELNMEFLDTKNPILKFGLGNKDIPAVIKRDMIQDLFPQIHNKTEYFNDLFKKYEEKFSREVKEVWALAQEIDGCSRYISDSAPTIFNDLLTAEGRKSWKWPLSADDKLFHLYSKLWQLDKFFYAPAVERIEHIDEKNINLVLDLKDDLSDNEVIQYTNLFDQHAKTFAEGLPSDIKMMREIKYPPQFGFTDIVGELEISNDISKADGQYFINFSNWTTNTFLKRAFGDNSDIAVGKIYVNEDKEVCIPYNGRTKVVPLTPHEQSKLNDFINEFEDIQKKQNRDKTRPKTDPLHK